MLWHPHNSLPLVCAESCPLYLLAVSGCIFSALLVDMTRPNESNPLGPSFPYHTDNTAGVIQFHWQLMRTCVESGGVTHQCAGCGKAWSSRAQGRLQRPKVRSLYGLWISRCHPWALMQACVEMGAITHQCASCGKGRRQRPMEGSFPFDTSHSKASLAQRHGIASIFVFSKTGLVSCMHM